MNVRSADGQIAQFEQAWIEMGALCLGKSLQLIGTFFPEQVD
jgi:hypothetical protein